MTDQPLRLLLVHEKYSIQGGEDAAVEADFELLSQAGHRVVRWSVDNRAIESWSTPAKLQLAWKTSWSRSSYGQMCSLIQEHRPDVVHFHNTLPLISPSAIHAAHDKGVPTVMTLHNYRLMCPVGTFLREGRICEDCRTRSLLRGVVHGCYRGSRIQTGAVAAMLAVHRRLGTWTRCVDAYVAPTEFVRSKAAEGGLPVDRVHVRPNPVGVQPSTTAPPEPYALFIGRLSEEKGIRTLLEAACLMAGVTVKVVGSGTLEPSVREAAASQESRVEYLGQLPHSETMRVLARAGVLLFPSICYETAGMTILEALAFGVPVIASRLGGREEIVSNGETGYLFAPGDAGDLASKALKILADPALRHAMSQAALQHFESRFSPRRSYERLMEIYDVASDAAHARRSAA